MIKINLNLFIESFSRLIVFIPVFMILGPAVPDIVVSISAIFFLIITYYQKNYDYLKDKIFISFMLFWFSIVFSSLFSNHLSESLPNSIVYVRFIFFTMFVKYYVSQNKFAKKYSLKIFVLVIIFVAIDSLIQSYFRVDLFGHKMAEVASFRLDGPFGGEEWIVGSFLSKYFLLCVSFFLISGIKSNFLKYLFFLFFLFLNYVTIFLSGERAAFLIANLSIILFFSLNLKLFKKLVLPIFVCLIILIPIIKNSNGYERFMSIFEILGIKDNFQNINIQKEEKNLTFWDSHYGAHYLTAIEIFKDNVLIGSGTKTFRIVCSDKKYESIDSQLAEIRCATHPHNFYLQILSENGLIGFLFFILFLTIIIKQFYNEIHLKNYMSSAFFISFLTFIWPINSTGNIFNNRYALMLFFLIALFLIVIKNNDLLIAKKSKKNYK